MTESIAILGCGMMTGVGLTAEASCAAIRARLDNFRETRFIATGGEWIIGSEVPLEQPWRGIAKLACLLAGPIRECLDQCPEVPASGIPLMLCVAEKDRPGRLGGLEHDLFHEASKLLGVQFHPDSRVIPHGRVGGAVGLQQAARLIHHKGHRRVIVAGVDSYLVGPTLQAYGERERLLTPENSNGFIPGEAGAALLVGPPDTGRGLLCVGFGFAVEKATVESEEPLRADGMVAALQQALAAAGLTMAQIGYRVTDLSGEQYAFKEADLAVSRILRDRHDFQDLWHPADCIGETGAAAVPGMLAVAVTAAREGYAAGDPVLAHSGNDDGRRAAIVLSAEGRA